MFRPSVNLTLTSFITGRRLVRGGLLISSGIGKSALFIQAYWAIFLPVYIGLQLTISPDQNRSTISFVH